MNVDVHVPRFTWPGGPASIGPTVTAVARTAEAIGIRTLSFMDHYFMDHYFQMERAWPAEEPMLEGYTALGFVAGVTQQLRMRLMVTGVTYRHPGLLAKSVTTLDVLSGGRAELGIGAAWYEREHLGLGVPFPPLAERFERLEEALQICLQMWSDDNGRFEGKHYQLAETLCSPPPISSPRPRILIGGGGERKTLRLVARYADACNINGKPDEIQHKLAVLRRHCDDVGRNPGEIDVTVTLLLPDDVDDPGEIVRRGEALAAIGVDTVMARPVGPDPAGFLERAWGPAVPRLAAVVPTKV
ncbi:MAG: LLM class F420-dependent oxidoreductase [Acidobacteria bacterium]|nr:LLM class F420-dependent oxidoreductase [Acidobacteriota bacterium]